MEVKLRSNTISWVWVKHPEKWRTFLPPLFLPRWPSLCGVHCFSILIPVRQPLKPSKWHPTILYCALHPICQNEVHFTLHFSYLGDLQCCIHCYSTRIWVKHPEKNGWHFGLYFSNLGDLWCGVDSFSTRIHPFFNPLCCTLLFNRDLSKAPWKKNWKRDPTCLHCSLIREMVFDLHLISICTLNDSVWPCTSENGYLVTVEC